MFDICCEGGGAGGLKLTGEALSTGGSCAQGDLEVLVVMGTTCGTGFSGAFFNTRPGFKCVPTLRAAPGFRIVLPGPKIELGRWFADIVT